jgi:Holliday junction resolvase RusA-like endonuclease
MNGQPVKSVTFDIPHLTPPSVNHYKMPVKIRTRDGIRNSWAKTPEAEAYQTAVAIFARGQTVAPLTKKERKNVVYCVAVIIVLGKDTRLDSDNGLKVLFDGLELAGVIHSDARIGYHQVQMIWNDRNNPRTMVKVWVEE